MFPPLDPLGDPNALDLGVGPAPTAPVAPTPGVDAGANRRRMMQLVVAALAAGMGPGRGTGLLQGMSAANAQRQREQQIKDQQAQQAYTQQRQDYQYQQRDYDQEQQRRQQAVSQTISKLAEIAPTLTKEEYDQRVEAYAAGLQGFGVRVSPNFLRSKVRYTAPTGAKLAKTAIDSFTSEKANEPFLKDPARLATVKLKFDRDGDGVPELVPYHEAADMAGVQYARSDDGSLSAYPDGTTKDQKASADGILQTLIAIATAEGKQITPALTLDLQQQAITLAKKAGDLGPDPTLAAIRQLTLQNAQAAKNSGALPPAVQRRVDAKTRGFDALPVVKTTQKLAEAVTFANSMDPNTKNPADDQALIYAFAKAMDPDSAVREGEYETVQKYAQSWAERFGFSAARIYSNTQFLTPQSRANMKATITKRYAAGKAQYDNVRKSYATQINRIIGSNEGDDYLIDYASGFPDGGTDIAAPETTGAAEEWERDSSGKLIQKGAR